MQEQEFWQIIEINCKGDDCYSKLTKQLSSMEPNEIIRFQNILLRQIAYASTFPVLAANFIIESYVSDDGFKNFRSWLISNGFDKFIKAVENPETISDWLKKEDVENIDGEWLLGIAQYVYEEVYEGDFLDRITFVPDPKIVQDWPESKAKFSKKWPKLVDKFWDQGKIKEMHAD